MNLTSFSTFANGLSRRNWGVKNWTGSFGWAIGTLGILPLGIALVSLPAVAQIIPDGTLGSERSRVTPNVNIKGATGNRIDGGAVRGSSLFHSFSEFNVNAGQRVYFRDPAGIANILTRVTGSNVSNILGKLGVEGAANLFLLNPNGFIFGPNAQLDIQGSFFATTANRFVFPNNIEFGATNPQAPPLLTMSVPIGVQYGSHPGNIVNTGNLKVGQDLTLTAGNLDLQGQLVAGRDLTLQAQDTVKVRDSVETPFLAQSGGNLTIQGNQGIDIWALNHPTQIPFVSGGNLSLISDGIISGDARFSSGSGFSIKSVSGGLANFFSYYDPIISANGDVDVAANYTGTSLLVEATGNIRFQGNITITGPDTSALPAGPDTATLSSGSALIMRSGQSTLAYGGVNSGLVPTYSTGNVPAGITIGGNVTLQRFDGTGRIVSLRAATGDVSTQGITTNGGAININSAWSITTNQRDLNTTNGNLDGGEIALTAGGNISTSYIYSSSSSDSLSTSSGNGGVIALTAGGNISTSGIYSSSFSSSSSSGNGGAIALTAGGNISTSNIQSYSFSYSTSFSNSSSSGNGGAVALTAGGNISTSNIEADSTSYSTSDSLSISSENGGAIFLTAGGNITTSSIKSDSTSFSLNSDSISSGNGGAIALTAGDNITTSSIKSYSYSYSFSKSYSTAGNGGAITLSGSNITAKGDLNSFSYSKSGKSGSGGEIFLSARDGDILGVPFDALLYDNVEEVRSPVLNSFSVSEQGTAGNGGNITLEAKNNVSNLEILTLSSSAQAGAVQVTGFGDLSLTNTNILTSKQLELEIKGTKITLDVGKTGQSGDVAVTSSGNLTFNNSSIQSDTKGSDPAGNVTMTSPGLVTFNNSQIISNTSSTGQAGSITLKAPELQLDANSILSAETSSSGRAGDLTLQPFDGGQTLSVFLQEGAKISASTDNIGQGGNITITAPELVTLSGQGSISATTSRRGQAGSVTINTPTLAIDGTQISTSTSGRGKGGDLNITAPNSFTLSNDGQLSAETTGLGQAGKVNIATSTLNINTGAKVSTTTTASATGTGGDITVSANTLNLSGANSGLFAETQGAANAGNLRLNPYSGNDLQVNFAQGAKVSASTSGSGTGGNLNVTAPNSVTLSGDGQLSAEATNGGNAGKLEITANQLTLQDGSSATVSSTGNGTAGNLTVNAPTVILDKAKLTATTQADSGGDIQLQNLSSLLLSNNSEISASTQSGNGGSVSIMASGGNVALSGNSNLKAEATDGGNAGNLEITANQLTLQDGSQATVSSTGSGTAGKLTVSAPEVILENSAKLTATTQSGSGGDIQLRNLSSLQLSNSSEISASTQSGNGGSVSVIAPGGNVALTGNSNLKAEATQGGNAGNLDITANQITLRDNSSATVSSPQGQAGNLSITANSLFLNAGQITAETGKRSDTGGANINLQLSDLLILRNKSLISANATGTANGGNITIRVPFIIALPSQNSDIIANAVSGDGGRIDIFANRVFGLTPQSGQSFDTLRKNRTNDLSASSQSGIQGTVNIQSLSIDPSQGLAELPTAPIDPSNLIAQGCKPHNAAAKRQSEFVVTGRGGLPPGADELQSGGVIAPEWVTRDGSRVSNGTSTEVPTATTAQTPLVEAQGMVLNANGDMVFTAQVPSGTAHQSGLPDKFCLPSK